MVESMSPDAREAEFETPNMLWRVDGLTKTYDGSLRTVGLDGISFDVDENEVIVVIGPNGAGKSTLINILAGALEPDQGELTLRGSARTVDFTVMQKHIGVVFQDNVMVDRLSLRENLLLFGQVRGVDPDELAERIDILADRLQLENVLESYAGDLSGGQKRKLCVAIALISRPPIILMDEPTAGVDVQARILIWKTIAELQNATSIITTHALEEAESVSSRLFVLIDHEIRYLGTASELREDYKCGYIMRFNGSDGSMNRVLDIARKYFSEEDIGESDESISLPVNENVAPFLEEIEERGSELGLTSYSFAIEQLEDTLMRILNN